MRFSLSVLTVLLLMGVALPLAPSCEAFILPQHMATVAVAGRPQQHLDPSKQTRLYGNMNQDPMRFDMSVTFGSDDDDDFGTEEDEFRSEQASRKAKIEALLQEQDVEFKEERRRKKWGKFANATTKEEIRALEEMERDQIAQGMYVHACMHMRVCVCLWTIL